MTRRELRKLATFALAVIAQLSLFHVLERLVRGIARLPSAAYESAVYTAWLPSQFLDLAGRRPWVVALVATAAAGLIVFSSHARGALRRSADGWDQLDDGAGARVLVGFITGLATWVWALYPYNPWFDQTHGLDRALLLVLWLLVLWRPLFLLPFSVVLLSTVSQFDIPLSGFSWTEADLILRVPILAFSFWMVRSASRRVPADTLVFLILCLLAVDYWWSGLGKVRVGWWSHPYVHYMVYGTHATGWLAFLEPDGVQRMAGLAETLLRPIMVFTLIVECGALLLLTHRRVLQSLLVLFIAFHTGVFLASGIFFWKWMLVEVGLLVYLQRGDRISRLGFFTPGHAALSMAVIGLCFLWVRPVSLTWYDSPLTYALVVEGEGESGEIYQIPQRSFRPYSDMFAMGSFPYASPHPHLTGSMGAVTRRALADSLVLMTDPEDVLALERASSPTRYDPAQADTLAELVARFAEMATREPPPPLGWLRPIRAPRHLWSMARGRAWAGQEPLARLRIMEETWFYDGERHRAIRRIELRSVPLEARSATARSRSSPTG